MKKVLYILNLNFNNKKRNSVNCDGDSYGFLDDKESLDFIRAEARLGQNLKTQLFLVYSLLALVPHCICPFLLDAGGCGCWSVLVQVIGGRWMKSTRITTTGGDKEAAFHEKYDSVW